VPVSKSKYSKYLKYTKDKYSKNREYANIFLIAKCAKHPRSTQNAFMNWN